MNVQFVAGQLTRQELLGLRTLAQRLSRLGISARVVCWEAPEDLPEQIHVLEWPGLGTRWRRELEVRRLCRGLKPRPDVCVGLGLEVSDLLVVMAEQDAVPYVLSIEEFPALGTRLRVSRRHFRGVLAASSDLAQAIVADLGLPPAWSIALEPGIEPASLAAGDAGREGEVGVVGLGAASDDMRGILTAFRAARRLTDEGMDVEYVVSGGKGAEAELRRMVNHLRLSDRTTFAEEEVVGEAFWPVFRVYCRSSSRPTTGLEVGQAMAHGVPAVVSDLPGLRQWVEPERTGLRVRPDDQVELATCLRWLIGNPEKAQTMGREAGASVETRFEPEVHAARLAAYLRRIVEGQGEVVVSDSTGETLWR